MDTVRTTRPGSRGGRESSATAVLIAASHDDRGLLSRALRAGSIELAAEIAEISQIAESVPASTNVDVAVICSDRATCLKELRQALPDARLILVLRSLARRSVREALTHGADGVVRMEEADSVLCLAVQSVLAGQLSLPGKLRRDLARPALSAREKQVLGMVVLGFTNGEIARQLHLAESTVKSHLSSAFSRLGVRSRNEATALILDADAGFGPGILAISDDVEPSGYAP